MLTEWFRVVCQFDNDCYELRPPRNTNCLCILKNTFFLSSAKPIAECKNRFPKCLVYASQTGYCKSNQKFMESQCPKACKFCSKLYSSCTRTSKFSGLLSVVYSHFRRGSRNKYYLLSTTFGKDETNLNIDEQVCGKLQNLVKKLIRKTCLELRLMCMNSLLYVYLLSSPQPSNILYAQHNVTHVSLS